MFPTILLLVALLPCGTASAEIPAPTRLKKQFIIAAHEWPPFASRESRYLGVLPRIVSQVLEAEGIRVEYRFMSWPDTLDGLLTEEYDAALIWVMSDLNREPFLLSDPILEYRSALYYRKDRPRPDDSNDLRGLRIGLNPYYVYDGDSYQLMKNRNLIPIRGKDDDNHFRHLMDGTIDVYLTPLLTSAPWVRNNLTLMEQDKLAYTTEIFKFPPTQLVLNRKREGSDDLIRQFNNGLKRLKSDGTLDRYLDDLRFGKY